MTGHSTAETEALRRALNALERMQARLEAVQQAAREPIAVIGLGCRFPGTEGPEAFADFLETGGDAVGEIPAERAGPFAAVSVAAVRRGGFFADVAGFDAGRFGVSDAEALAMDPHQRLVLELAWEALADAGLTEGALAGTRTGVYLALGAQNNDYAGWLLNDPQRLNSHVIGGSFHSLMPGRLSYLLDLRGPSLVVDAACASALTALHLAGQALRRRECDTALVAAVNLVLSPLVALAVQQSGLLSPSGRCRSFDASADGFVRGEGGGVLVLKRLSDAVATGAEPWAVILGSAIGQDGHGNGLSAPHGPAQEAILRQALAEAGVEPAAVGYVEAHATGTRLGDAIEAQALGAVYSVNRVHPLRIGAVKPNLGHLEAASGMAGLIKVILAMQRRIIPPTLHLERLNSDIDPAELELVTVPTPWPENAALAGVSAFGMSGAGAHVIVGPTVNQRRSRLVSPPFQRRRFWLDDPQFVIPAKAGIHDGSANDWIPAFAGMTASESRDLNDLIYQLDWRPAPFAAPHRAPGRLLLLGDEALAHRLLPGLVLAGFTAALATTECLPDDPEATLLYLAGGGLEPDLATLRQQERRILGGLLRLVQGVAEQKARRLWIVTEGGWDQSLTAAMILALGRTIALEHPELGCRRIDLDPQLTDPATVLAEDLASDDDEEWVRHTPAGRLIPRLTPFTVKVQPFTARPDAAYLITGGMGGIGRAVAGWLIARGARHLLLLGRTLRQCPERAAWKAQGVQVKTVAADVADPAALAEILAGLDAEGVPLAGVFHVAGVTADQLLFRQDWPAFANALRAKAEGALALHQATAGRPLDMFVLFSSITVLCGLAGTGAYAAANAALGALARWRRRQNLPALSIQWGTWEGSGMAEAAGAELVAQWQAHGLLSFPPATGLAALEALLATPDLVEAVAARADWSRLARWAREEGSGAELYAERVPAIASLRPVTVERPVVNDQSLETLVRESVAEVLGLAVADPALDRPFGELGLNSLAAITLRNRLSGRLGLPIPATLAFNHPSVAAIVRFLATRSIATPPASSTNRSRIERMTEVEAEQHLAALLADLESKTRP
ncbi:MAG: SDR family NAD(P)-dependent oxidoreductase [Candidatus Competibacteraceae bacterium]